MSAAKSSRTLAAKVKPYTAADAARMVELARFTAKSLKGRFPTPFGCEIVRSDTGERVVREVNHGGQLQDPTAHAETYAIRQACKKLKSISLKGHTLYTTCEPCPMCMAASLWAGVDKVIYGATIDDAARYCGQIYTYSKNLVKKSDLVCEVVGPVSRAECVAVFEQSPLRRVQKPKAKRSTP